MTIIPNQFFGLGDIIFTQTLVRRIADGRHIIWPVLAHFVEGLQRAYPDIKFIDHRTVQIDFERKDQYEFEHPQWGRCTVLPLRWADQLLNVPYTRCMRAKYDLYGMDFEDWREEAMWKQDTGTANLLYDVKTLHTLCNPYSFGNNIFGSDGKLTVPIPKCDVNMEILPMHSLFDWAYILQDASEIHTVNTSILYLIDLLDIRAKEVHVYQRSIPGQTFETVDYLFKKHKYIYHG